MVWSEPLGEVLLSQRGARRRRALFPQERSSTEGLFMACAMPKVKMPGVLSRWYPAKEVRSNQGVEVRISPGRNVLCGLASGWCRLKSPVTRVGVGDLENTVAGRKATEEFQGRR